MASTSSDLQDEDFPMCDEEGEELISNDDNVDWVTVRQLVFSRLSFMFNTERIQEAMESTRKPNSNDWIRAAATKIASEWRQLIDTPSSDVFPLVALPEDLLKRIFNQYCPTRDMMALGLVSQQFRRCVNWNKHYLTLDCSSMRLQNFTLNGSRIPVEKWPKLVELLLDKTIITSFWAKFREVPPIKKSKAYGFIKTVLITCMQRNERLHLEKVTILSRQTETFFGLLGPFPNLRAVNISGTCLASETDGHDIETEGLINELKDKEMRSIELNLREKERSKLNPPKNVDIAQICAQIRPHTLHSLITDSPKCSLLEFVRNVPSDNISCLTTLSYIGHHSVVNWFNDGKETIELLWQRSPHLQYCKFTVQHRLGTAPLLLADLFLNIFEVVQSHTECTGPITIVLGAKLEDGWSKLPSDLSYFPLTLHPCHKAQFLARLQESHPETSILEEDDNIFDKEFIGTYTIKRGQISITIERTSCQYNTREQCKRCAADYQLLLRAVYERLDFGLRRSSALSKKLLSWTLHSCQADRLVEDLKRKFVNVKLELMPRKRKADKSYLQRYMISLRGDSFMIQGSRCFNRGCNVCSSISL